MVIVLDAKFVPNAVKLEMTFYNRSLGPAGQIIRQGSRGRLRELRAVAQTPRARWLALNCAVKSVLAPPRVRGGDMLRLAVFGDGAAGKSDALFGKYPLYLLVA